MRPVLGYTTLYSQKIIRLQKKHYCVPPSIRGSQHINQPSYFKLNPVRFPSLCILPAFSNRSLRMSEKHGTLESLDLRKRGRLMTEGFEKTLREKKKMLLSSNFPFCFKNVFYPSQQKTVCVSA